MEHVRMADKGKSRFDAEKVRRLAAVNNHKRRVEVEFSDSSERKHVVSLPVDVAVALGRLICDLTEGTPFLENEKPRKDKG
jgi:hypothetical protein